MIIVALMLLGFVTLLVAPRLHRRSTVRARTVADSHRAERTAELRAAPDAVEHRVDSMAVATRLRDALLLRGVRSAVVEEGDAAVVITAHIDSAVVDELLPAIAEPDDPARS